MPNAQGTEQGGSSSAEKATKAKRVKTAAAGKTATGPEWVEPLTFDPGLRPTSGPGKVLVDDIVVEVEARLARGSASTLDDAATRTREKELIGLLLEGAKHVDAEGRPLVEGFHYALQDGFHQLAQALHLHNTAPTGAHRYLVGAWQATAAAFPLVAALREDARERLGLDPATATLRHGLGVGRHLRQVAPLEVLDVGLSQLKVLDDEALAEVLRRWGIDPERRKKKLKPAVDALAVEIKKGTGVELKKGGATSLVDVALLSLDVVCSRIPVFFRDYGRPEDAERFAARPPPRDAQREEGGGGAGRGGEGRRPARRARGEGGPEGQAREEGRGEGQGGSRGEGEGRRRGEGEGRGGQGGARPAAHARRVAAPPYGSTRATLRERASAASALVRASLRRSGRCSATAR